MKSRKFFHKGFTLIELLVVIAIIAILAIVVILTLNPGQLIAQARDSNRISDIATIKSAIAYYLQDVTGPNLGLSLKCYESGPTAAGAVVTVITCPWFVGITAEGSTANRTVGGLGWIPINFSAISVGSPIGQLPSDPLNTATAGAYVNGDSFYSYAASTTSAGGFKLGANMESVKYSSGGSGDVETNDGGISTSTYEQGSNLAL
jgi:prepilin-type N-terminal cleavage/methylation domain-containing protein